MFNIVNQKGNANQNYVEIPLCPSQMATIKKTTIGWDRLQPSASDPRLLNGIPNS
jgi:hypothetical protein